MRSFRTVLEQKIWERRQTLEGFAEYAETYAREHNEAGTLGVRHLQRLVAGRRSDGRPLGPVKPETARLLEQIFTLDIDELLSPPAKLDLTKYGTGVNDEESREAARAFRVAIAVVVKEAEALIVCRRDSTYGGLTWQFPAGIVKPGISSIVAAVRETLAETAVHCAPRRKLGSRVHPITNVLCDYVLCDYLAGYARNLDLIENVGVLWVNKDRLPSFIAPDLIYPPVMKVLDIANI